MNRLMKLMVGGVGLAVIGLLIGSLLTAGDTAQAQLSCDNPPLDVSRLVRVWTLTDFCIAEEGVFDEILSGGVGRDGIPPIDDPLYEGIDAADDWLLPQSPVIIVAYNDIARAYPLAILTRHEIVNTEYAGVPVAVTFCPLCNSAIAFIREVDGVTLRFGVSGLLRNSDLVMWDDVSQSWWQQLTGIGIVGRYTGTQLEMIPTLVTGFSQFAQQYPDGEVLSPRGRRYADNPYVGYDSSADPFLFTGQIDDRLFATERVLAGVIGGEAQAYPFPILEELRVINDSIGGREVVALWQPGAASALDRRDIDNSRDVGMAALYRREVDDMALTFALNDAGQIVDEQTGTVWNFFGQAVEGELAGAQLRQELANPHFWFAWAAFFPETGVYGQ